MMNLLKYTFLILFMMACTDPFSSSAELDGSLLLDLQLNSDQVESPEDLEAIFTVRNVSDSTLSYEFPTGCQSGFTIEQDGQEILEKESSTVCTMALSTLSLEPDESKAFDISLSNIEEEADTLEPGEYQINAFLLENHSKEITKTFEIK